MDHQNNGAFVRLYSSQRSCIYKASFFAIIFSFFIYTYTFISQHWISVIDDDGDEFSEGLWSSCDPDCSGDRALTAAQAMACICMIGYLFTIMVGLLENCRLVPPNYHSRKLDWSALFTGIVGILAELVYVLMYFIRIDTGKAFLDRDCAINFTAIVILLVAVTIIFFQNRNPQVARGRVISTQQPVLVHYNQAQSGQPVHQFNYHTAPRHADFAPYQNEPFLQQYPAPIPSAPPPPYSPPPAYPGYKY